MILGAFGPVNRRPFGPSSSRLVRAMNKNSVVLYSSPDFIGDKLVACSFEKYKPLTDLSRTGTDVYNW
ncbi:hypothetical protein KTE91_22940 [Burkholderia multivorans]|nr:hypothetical protein [Burkholderia multivorans]MCO8647147.1 hypothetical protein [Burkholderia multivorans]